MDKPVEAVRAELRRRDYAAVIVPRADEHLGEYIPPHRERLRWLTGFTGSAGCAIVLRDGNADAGAALFVDGRYTVQVRRQVDSGDFAICHLTREPPETWLCAQLQSGDRVVIDPRLHTQAWFERMEAALGETGIGLVADADNLVDRCWHDGPPAQREQALLLDERFTGESSADKRRRLGQQVAEAGADAALVFAPESVSWLLNVRGSDIPRLPVLQACAFLHASGELDLIVDPGRIPAGFDSHVGAGVRLHPESALASLLASFSGRRVLADPASANAAILMQLDQAGAVRVAGADPALLPRACKNAVEISGAVAAHVRDGAALVRFLAWLDGETAAGRLHDEAVLAQKLHGFREVLPHFREPSFDTISAAGPNAALCHYNHRNDTPATLAPDSVYLVDSGGQYLDGTTDVTRTVAVGSPPDAVRHLFTRVLKGHIALDRALFPAGTTGTHLDALARQFLWQAGCDYDHGTGHGVGAFLSVHEGPQNISRAWNGTPLAAGMIVSNEPGYYRDGEFGIRCENLVVVEERTHADFDRPMLGFRALTLAPFDRRLVAPELMSDDEIAWLDSYHHRVRDTLTPMLEDDVAAWLEQATRPLATH